MDSEAYRCMSLMERFRCGGQDSSLLGDKRKQSHASLSSFHLLADTTFPSIRCFWFVWQCSSKGRIVMFISLLFESPFFYCIHPLQGPPTVCRIAIFVNIKRGVIWDGLFLSLFCYTTTLLFQMVCLLVSLDCSVRMFLGWVSLVLAILCLLKNFYFTFVFLILSLRNHLQLQNLKF